MLHAKSKHYCKMCDTYVEKCSHGDKGLHPISGSRIREIFQEGKRPEDWQIHDIDPEECRGANAELDEK